MENVALLWTRYGTDDILVRDTEGVLRGSVRHLDPDGCLVQQHEHQTYEDAAKVAGDTTPIRQNGVWSIEATLSKKSCRGEIYFLDKGLFMGAIGIDNRYHEHNTVKIVQSSVSIDKAT